MAVLGVATIIAVIGLSSLTASRIQRRSMQLTYDAGRARTLAVSAVDVALFAAELDSDWRTKYVDDEWAGDIKLSTGTIAYKFVDELDNDLTNDALESVRLHGKATVGEAVRIYSVLLEPLSLTPDNLLINPGIENGTTGWTGRGFCTLSVDSTDSHSGSSCLLASGRMGAWTGPNQDMLGIVEKGITYDCQAWVRVPSGSLSMLFTFYVYTDAEVVFLDSPVTVVGNAWTLITAKLTPTWTGTVIEAFWYINNYGPSSNFKIDDALLADEETGGIVLKIDPDSWRQEVLP